MAWTLSSCQCLAFMPECKESLLKRTETWTRRHNFKLNVGIIFSSCLRAGSPAASFGFSLFSQTITIRRRRKGLVNKIRDFGSTSRPTFVAVPTQVLMGQR